MADINETFYIACIVLNTAIDLRRMNELFLYSHHEGLIMTYISIDS